MSRAFTPKEAMELKITMIPEYVFDAFNEIIAKNLTLGHRAIFKQKDVVSLIVEKSNGDIDREGVFSRNMLDVTSHYRKAGWKIDHDRPGYNESYDAMFTFDKK